jgi:hypothetical protein
MIVSIFIEGGGDKNRVLADGLRWAFGNFLKNTGLAGAMPKVIPCGARYQVYRKYCHAIENNIPAMMLIDSESPVDLKYSTGDIHDWKPWEHILNRKSSDGIQYDKWIIVGSDTDCHLMVQMTESWFFADKENLVKLGFKDGYIKDYCDVEKICKDDLIGMLERLSKNSYSKGRDSYRILSSTDPQKVIESSKWAARFIKLLHEKIFEL